MQSLVQNSSRTVGLKRAGPLFLSLGSKRSSGQERSLATAAPHPLFNAPLGTTPSNL